MKTTKRELIIGFYMNKTGAEKLLDFHSGDYITYTTEKGLPAAIVFLPRECRPLYHYYFKTEEKRAEFIEKQRKQDEINKQREDENKRLAEERKAALAPGDILYCSWGYEQTNVDFYKVLSRKGDFVTVQEVGSKRDYHALGDRGQCVADPDNLLGESFRKKITGCGGIKLSSYQYAYKWDGSPLYWSDYA